ncbi:MAG: sulfatase [Planctomycetota bacterium]
MTTPRTPSGLFLAASISVTGAAHADPLNVCVIMAEDMGLQLNAYADHTVPTPNSSALAERGVTFERAYCTAPTCSPSRASFFTGLYPHQNGHVGLALLYDYKLHRGVPTLPQMLSDAGYRTGVSYKIHVRPESQVGFDVEYTHKHFQSVNKPTGDVVETGRVFEEFLDEQPADTPFFFMLNTHATHRPFNKGQSVEELGPPYEHLDALGPDEVPFFPDDIEATNWARKDLAMYYNAVQRFDYAVGLVVDALEERDLLDDTLIILTSDHGPPLGRGKLSIHEFGLRIPVIVAWPGESQPGLRREELISMVDLTATIFDATGVEPPEVMEGASLRPLVRGEAPAWRDAVFAEFIAHTTYHQLWPSQAVITDTAKLIHNMIHDRPVHGKPIIPANTADYWSAMQSPTDTLAFKVYDRYTNRPEFELYDLAADPYEFHDRAQDAGYETLVADLRHRLDKWRACTADPFADADYLDRFVAYYADQQRRVDEWKDETGGDVWSSEVIAGDQTPWQRDWADVAREIMDARRSCE